MPQLDISSYISQMFWLLLSFCMLWFLLSFFVVPKLADIIEQRKRKIDEYVQKADILNAKAQASLEKYNETIALATKQAEDDKSKSKEKLKAYLQKTEADMAESLNKKIADNEFVLATEKSNTLQQIEVIAQDLAYQIVHKLGFSNIRKQDIVELSQKDRANG